MLNINDIDSIRRNMIAQLRESYTYKTIRGTVGIVAPYTSIVGDIPYTANFSYPTGIDQCWKTGFSNAMKLYR